MARAPWGAAAAAVLVVLAGAGACEACFGTKLRILVPAGGRGALASYAAGYFLEEKTGVEPEFVEGDEGAAVDLRLVPAARVVPPGVVARPAGDVPGLGAAKFWLRAEVLDDLRFTTVERALARLPSFFSSPAFLGALGAPASPKKAARKAVLDAR